METIDLITLGGKADNYLVEGMDEDFLLIRSNQQGFLMMIDRTLLFNNDYVQDGKVYKFMLGGGL